MDDNGLLSKFGNVDHFLVFVFLIVLGLTAFWQYSWSFRPIQDLLRKKWLNHLGLAFINLLVLRVLFAGSILWAARLAARHHWGLFQNVEAGFLFSVVFTVVFLDWMAYYLHRIYHAVPFLWNIHRVHHTDTEVESTTGLRFHPLEQVATTLWKGFFIVLLGAPFSGVFIYEVLLLASILFNHTNARLPKWMEPLVRLLFVTPDMHRVHHSSEPKETNSNFGFIFSFWDRALMTYQSDSRKGQEGIVLGLEVYREAGDQGLTNLLKQPFLGTEGKFKWSNLWNKNPSPQGKAAKA
jgi:sterol desaturase/sphingolipid hydroxylase (fatty acid hydroxylase superfamily)